MLQVTGFDEKMALKYVNVEEIQNFLQENWLALRNKFKGTVYADDQTFKLLPGHRRIILNLSNMICDAENASENDNSKAEKPMDLSNFSVVLQSLIETALSNANKNSKQHRYNEIIRSFSTYVYLMCGRACYETLSANLPIPKASTICKWNTILYYLIQFLCVVKTFFYLFL